MSQQRSFQGLAYLHSLHTHYPELMQDGGLATIDEQLHIGFVKSWITHRQLVDKDSPRRWVPLSERVLAMKHNVWVTSFDRGPEGLRRVGASSSYKGLIHLKPPCDLVLYSNLIWEQTPATIIEFGALQGGSALWFADQLDTLCGAGEVHSFELLDKCIHPSAEHPRLHFHRADLRDLTSLDTELLARLPHPWLVIDDAHEDTAGLLRFMGPMLRTDDYYVLEDVLLKANAQFINELAVACEQIGLMVDTKFTDAFGYNVTCAANGWLCKR
jgi:cephalosporin hydroxylase